MNKKHGLKIAVLVSVICGYGAPHLSAELVLHWAFDDGTGSGTAADSTTNSHTGVLTNMDPANDWITTGLPSVPGGTTYALDFDGGNDTVNASNDGYQGVTGKDPRTVAAWIKTSDLCTITSWGNNATGQKFTFRTQDSNGTSGALRVEVNGGYQVGAKAVNDGQWHHVAAVLPPASAPNVTDIRLYIDGEVQGSSAAQSTAINTAANVALRVGADFSNPYFKGQMDEFRLYDSALTSAEISALANVSDLYVDAVLADVPDVYWRLGENAGARAVNEGSSWAATDAAYANMALTDRYLPGLITTSPNRAIRFDGHNDRVNIPDHDSINLSSYTQKTLESWFMPLAYATNDLRRVIYEQGGSSNGFNQYLQRDGDDYFFRCGAWGKYGTTARSLFPTKVFVETGRVYHAVSVYDASKKQLIGYLNGACVTAGENANMGTVPAHTDDSSIGCVTGTTLMDNGSNDDNGTNSIAAVIDEVATYNNNLTFERIQEHYIVGSSDKLGLRDGVTRGVLLNYDADNDTDGDNIFEDSIGSRDTATLTNQFDWALTGVERVAVSDQMAAVTNAYRFDGSDTAYMKSIQYAAGYVYQNSATIEMVFDPADFNGNEALFETGGSTTGSSLALNGSTLRLYTKYSNSNTADVQFDLNELSSLRRNGFIHVVGVMDIENTNSYLYVNGELKAEATLSGGAISEWSGNNEAGLGCVNGTLASPVSLGKFTGDIAVMRLYPSVLSADQVQANYLALEPPPLIPGLIIMIQ